MLHSEVNIHDNSLTSYSIPVEDCLATADIYGSTDFTILVVLLGSGRAYSS